MNPFRPGRPVASRPPWLRLLALSLAVAAVIGASSVARPAALPPPDSASLVDDWPKIRQQTFEVVWETVHHAYFDPTFGGVDWESVRTTFQAQADQASDLGTLRATLQQMLARLGQSHFAILPRDAAVFTPEERQRLGTTGATVVGTPGGVWIASVREHSPAARAGLKPGDAIIAVDDIDLDQARAHVAANQVSAARQAAHLTDFVTSRLQVPVGGTVQLKLRRPGGAVEEATVTTEANGGEWSEPVGNFPSQPIECETRYHEPGIAYLRLSTFSPGLMAQIRPFLRSLPAHDGLVLDLRGNRGGVAAMASGVAGLLVTEELTLGSMRLRRGVIHFEVYPQERAFTGPVAVLIDHSSASTSEILAAGLQEAGRARLFGQTSAGAALPSSFKTLPTGDILQFAIADVQTAGSRRIEGKGVRPDVVIEWTPDDLAAGRDPALAGAVAWLRGQVSPASVSAAAANGPLSRPMP